MIHIDNKNNNVSTGVLIGFLASVLVAIFLLLVNYLIRLSSTPVSGISDCDKLAVEINAVNNILTWGSFIVAVLTIVAAVFGIAGFVQIKNNLDYKLQQTKNELDGTIDKYSTIFEKAEILVNSADRLKQSLAAQQLYSEKSNESLFQAVFAIANRVQNKDIAKALLNQQSHIAEIINLYRPSIIPEDLTDVSQKKLAALLYFQANGKRDDLPHLKYVAENDIDPVVRKKAEEVIIRIELRKEQSDEDISDV